MTTSQPSVSVEGSANSSPVTLPQSVAFPASDADTPQANTTSGDAPSVEPDAGASLVSKSPAFVTSISLNQRDKTLILGDFKTGKTTFAQTLLAASPSYVAWDPTWALVDDGPHDISGLKDTFRRVGRAVLQPDDEDAMFEPFCAFAFECPNTLVFIDEPADSMGSRSTIPPAFQKLHRRGHKRGQGLVLATHRFHGDLPAITRVFDNLFVFRCSVDVDLEALRPYLGDVGVEWVKQAPRYHFWARMVTPNGIIQGPCRPVRPTALK